MAAESYLVKQAKRRKHEYLTAEVASPRLRPFELEEVPLRDAPEACKNRFNAIMRRNQQSAEQDEASQLGKVVFDSMDAHAFDSGTTDSTSLGGHAATVVGSCQQGKTTMLNSLLTLFGFNFQNGGSFPDTDLLPTHSKDRIGLPFPLRLEHGPRYEMHLRRWEAQELEALMCIAADKALAKNAEYFDDLDCGFETVKEKSFLQFVARHGALDEEQCYRPRSSAAETLKADGVLEIHDFESDAAINPSLEAHNAVFKFLVHLVEEGLWFHYKHVILKCPSQLLKHLSNDDDNATLTYVLDLPGVGIVDDNNSLVEELVFRDVRDANTIIVLTGERSFTQDVLQIVKSSVFERLLDPHVTPPPTVAITNSRNLRGLKKEEMDFWRTATLEGTMGWNREIQAFAKENFTERRARDTKSIEPELFPNDLSGFLEAGTGADDKGVSMLVGYFLRLPQESLIAHLNEVREKARSVILMLNQLRQANIELWNGPRPSRLAKEVRRLRDEEYQRDMDSKLTLASQKRMFGFETESSDGEQKTLQTQLDYIDVLFKQQRQKLVQKFEKLKNEHRHEKHEWTRVVRDALIQVASWWDDNVGCKAFERFLHRSQELSTSLYEKWARQTFLMDGRDNLDDLKKEGACNILIKYLNETATKRITSKDKNFQYTWTHGLRQQSWNLDLDIISKVGGRKGRSASVSHNQIRWSIEELMKAKQTVFKDQTIELMSLRSQSIKQLVTRLKKEIIGTFENSVKNFCVVMNALDSIAQGKVTASGDSMVILFDELGKFTTQLDRYIEAHRKLRDRFGAQELQSLLEKRTQVM